MAARARGRPLELQWATGAAEPPHALLFACAGHPDDGLAAAAGTKDDLVGPADSGDTWGLEERHRRRSRDARGARNGDAGQVSRRLPFAAGRANAEDRPPRCLRGPLDNAGAAADDVPPRELDSASRCDLDNGVDAVRDPEQHTNGPADHGASWRPDQPDRRGTTQHAKRPASGHAAPVQALGLDADVGLAGLRRHPRERSPPGSESDARPLCAARGTDGHDGTPRVRADEFELDRRADRDGSVRPQKLDARRLVQRLTNRTLDVRAEARASVEERGHPDQARGARPPRPLVQTLYLGGPARKEQQVGLPEHDAVQRRSFEIANLEVGESEQSADPRCGKDLSAHLGGPRGSPPAREAAGGETRAAVPVDPAGEGRHEVLSPPR